MKANHTHTLSFSLSLCVTAASCPALKEEEEEEGEDDEEAYILTAAQKLFISPIMSDARYVCTVCTDIYMYR